MPAPFHLPDFLPYRLTTLAARVSRHLSAAYGQVQELSVPEWRVMAHLHEAGEVSVRDIQIAAGLEKSRVSRAVARLGAAGLVQKVQGLSDARLVAISLSPAGVAALSQLLPIALAVEERLLEGVPPADLAAFLRVIAQLDARLVGDAA
ncbi:MAG: MarR family winged helix-turn-helix transcriptional regulator [Gemmobacter sp.]